jgi:RecJ-like exonuclease
MKTCPDCNGDGVVEKGTDDEQQCPTCGGSGFVPDDNDDDREEVIKTLHGANYNGGTMSIDLPQPFLSLPSAPAR